MNGFWWATAKGLHWLIYGWSVSFTPPLLGPIFFNFMQFSVKSIQNNKLAPIYGIAVPWEILNPILNCIIFFDSLYLTYTGEVYSYRQREFTCNSWFQKSSEKFYFAGNVWTFVKFIVQKYTECHFSSHYQTDKHPLKRLAVLFTFSVQ